MKRNEHPTKRLDPRLKITTCRRALGFDKRCVRFVVIYDAYLELMRPSSVELTFETVLGPTGTGCVAGTT